MCNFSIGEKIEYTMIKKLNKKVVAWGAVLCVVIGLVVLISLLAYGGEKRDIKLSTYSLNLTYKDKEHVLIGQEKVEYVNNYDNMFTELYFHLYPNAFREGAKNGVVTSNNFSDAYPNGSNYGEIKIASVTFEDGENATFEVAGEDKNILIVDLKEELYPDESVVLNISFETELANINHRLGYGEKTINFGNFYPIACVYESGNGFSQSLYHSNGDPFYSECANYNVIISYNSIFEIASTGCKNKSVDIDGNTKAEFEAENVRDFCFVLSNNFEKVSQNYNGVAVNYFGYSGDTNLQQCLQAAVDAVSTFCNMYGEYPYSQISVVKSNFVHGGMEYPNIVLISDAVSNQSDVNYVIIHEIAHQWWYGLVGNDEYNHAWLDEGLAEYSTLLFYRENEKYGENFDSLINGAVKSYKLFEDVYTRVTGSVDGRMDRALCDFQTEPEYVQCTYNKGVIMFNSLRETIGDKKFFGALEDYFSAFKYKNARPEDLIAVFVKVAGRSVESFFESWLQGKVVIK